MAPHPCRNAAVLFEGGNWDKLVTMPIKILEQA
jgi:hypothetical protein